MYIGDVNEAVPICNRVLGYMLQITATRGRTGADMRTAIGDFLANCATLLRNDLAGPPLSDIFDKSRLAGITLTQLDAVRAKAVAETPKSVGAILIQNSLINYTLVVESRVIAGMTFISREDVDAMKLRMNDAFAPMEEIAADEMDQMTYAALVRLHAAVTFYLVETARPLPQMLAFQFYQPSIPTLIAAYRLYSDASRADEIRAENKCVHPAFLRPTGRALSN